MLGQGRGGADAIGCRRGRHAGHVLGHVYALDRLSVIQRSAKTRYD